MSSSETSPRSDATPEDASSPRLSAWLALRVLIVRLRFFLVLLGVLLLVGSWPTLSQYWQRLMGKRGAESRPLADDMEFWCPMCPGVVSDFAGKCPVCNMALVRRKKGEAVPLPDGVLARMQFSPYRVQLAGIRTAVIDYRSLHREVVLVGPVQRSTLTSPAIVRAEVFTTDLPFLTQGQVVEVSSQALSGHVPFRGRILRIDKHSESSQGSLAVQMEIEDPERDLSPGMLATAHAEAPITRLPWWRRAVSAESDREFVVDVTLHGLLTPTLPGVGGGLASLLRQAGTQVMLAEGYGLAVPCGAVIDHGSHKVVFIEIGAGMFDAVEITVGPRCGDYYPVLRGVNFGQRVAATGAFLLDAEMWLNHGLAATYFGATRGAGEATPAVPSAAPNSLSAEDQLLASKQKICPVTGESLDSMGGPVRVKVAGRVVFICCKACEKALRRNPAKYLSKLPAK